MRQFLLIPFLFAVILCGFPAAGQQTIEAEKEEKKKTSNSNTSPKWDFGGYLHNLQTITHSPDLGLTLLSSLFHNRINVKWYPTDKLSFGLEQRTRFFVGNDVVLNPLFDTQLDADPGVVDLSWIIWSGNSAALHTRVERFWMEYQATNWEIRIGRQRINWGVHLFWNPHDIFNTYSFLEVDNIERSGTDAIRGTFFIGSTTLDLAYAPGSQNTIDSSTHTAAARFLFNKWTYDFQLIAGWRFSEAVSGLAWAGNLGSAGFKGEFAAYKPVLESAADTTTGYVLSLSVDQSFDKPIFITAGFLYSSRGSDMELNLLDASVLGSGSVNTISPSLLLPSKYAVLGQLSWSVNPLLGVDFTTLYGPGPDLLIFFPSVRYSISKDWDLFAAAQILYIGSDEGLNHTADVAYIRVRWNY